MPASPDALASLFPAYEDAATPRLIYYSPRERIELTGHVLAMWAAKIAGFLSEQAPASPTVHLGLPLGWRTVTWCLGTWLAGGSIVTVSDRDREAFLDADVSVAQLPQQLADADIQLLLPASSLAVAWDGGHEGAAGERPVATPLPPLVYDGVADVMTYPDVFQGGSTQQRDSAFSGCYSRTRQGLASQAREVGEAWRREQGGRHAARVIDVLALLTGGQSEACGTGVLMTQVLAAWAGGYCPVLVRQGEDSELLTRALRQENAWA